MHETSKIGVVGGKDAVLCFKAVGIDVFAVGEDDQEQCRRTVDRLAREGYGIIFITEQAAAGIAETIDRYKNQMLPAIILIPGSQGSLGIGLQRIRDNVEKAVGRNIL